jgi:hypothetical protein
MIRLADVETTAEDMEDSLVESTYLSSQGMREKY